MAILWGFAGASSLGLYNIIPLFLVTERGLGLETANRVFGLSRLGGLILTFMAGYLADRYGARRVLLLALLVTGAATIALALVKPFPLLVAALVAQATFCPVFFPVGLVAISKLTDFDERSLFTGITVAFGVIFGNGFTPFLLGVAADVWSFQVGILALGLLTSMSTVLLSQVRGI
ncbi:MAG: MFS transporter [Deltaproteobacteria bacterium]|nr:MFS transporter [Deltaproteobacteria bacterium]